MSDTFTRLQVRRILPRWRSPKKSASLGEANPLTKPQSYVPTSSQPDKKQALAFQHSLELWGTQRTLGFAYDVINGAYALGSYDLAKDAARFVLDSSQQLPPQAIKLALHILDERVDAKGFSSQSLGPGDVRSRVIQTIRQLKQQLHIYPKNPLAWLELARNYTILGQLTKAEKCLHIALSLAPDHRLVVRAASRFFIHIGERDQALSVLRKSSNLKLDPWVQAAEIAVSQFVGRAPVSANRGKQLIRSENIAPFHTSELSAALGSLELDYGSSKAAQKQFKLAIVDPTENALAQTSWAVRDRNVPLIISADTPVNAHEVEAWNEYYRGNWHLALENSMAWWRDEPYSQRATSFATHVAAIGFEDYELASQLTKFALTTNPDDPVLLNNLAFELASSDRVVEAASEFRKIQRERIKDGGTQIALWATSGLIAYRSGDSVTGRINYEEAIGLARQLKQDESEAMATLYHTRERLRINDTEVETDLARVREILARYHHPSLQALLKRLEATTNKRTAP
jgi:tetratricopeptide (TPR) repeat protein